MSSFPDVYETVNNITDTGIQYFFVSEGVTDVIKAVQYSYVLDFHGWRVYNLGFGDYHADTDSISDDLTTNNGDPFRVFHTVLGTIPQFFKTYSDAMTMVWGSDSKEDYQEKCRLSCKKKCSGGPCKNAHRRINIYRNFVNKNLETLTQEYFLYGGTLPYDNQIIIEDYIKDKPYASVLLRKK